jgi:hypothetical protein
VTLLPLSSLPAAWVASYQGPAMYRDLPCVVLHPQGGGVLVHTHQDCYPGDTAVRAPLEEVWVNEKDRFALEQCRWFLFERGFEGSVGAYLKPADLWRLVRRYKE